MTKDVIERAIKRGVGADQDEMEEVCYEGYGVGGVAMLVDCLTDNRNRTVAEVRHAFTKCGGNLGTEGSVAYLFTKQGVILFLAGVDENKLMEISLEMGALDIKTEEDGSVAIYTSPENYEIVHNALVSAGFTPQSSEVCMLAMNEVQLTEENTEKIIKLIDMLEELDDVQNVYTNANIIEK